MEAFLLVILMLGGLAAAGVWYSTQMKKNYLHELEGELGIQDFVMRGGMGQASVEGRWKGLRVSIEALPLGPGMPSAIYYRLDTRSGFTADIRPGPALLDEFRERQKASVPAPASRGQDIKPWRARLTEEEEAVIRGRSGEAAGEAVPRERFLVTSPKPDGVAAWLGTEGRADELAALFQGGCTLVQLGFAEVVAVRSPYTAVDMTPKVVEGRLKRLRVLRAEGSR